MNLQSKFFLIIVLFVITQCGTSPKKEFAHKSSKQWVNYLKDIGVENADLSSHVLLVSPVTVCTSCLKELSWWNREGHNLEEVNVSLIILERYQSSFQKFVSSRNITIPAFQDSSGLIFKYDLIPYPPVKIYFDKNKKIAAIEPIGTNGNLSAFIEEIDTK